MLGGMERRRAIGYVRKSQVRKDADVPGLERQREAIEEWCRKNDVDLVKVFEEHKSAWGSKGRFRPSLKSAIESVRVEGAQILLTWRTDRLTRGGLIGLGAILEPLHENGGFFKSTSENLSSETPGERIVLGVTAGIADAESDATSKRVREARRSEAMSGQAHGGGVRPFGFNEDRTNWDGKESVLIRQAALDLINGASYNSISRRWNESGVLTARGKKWSAETVSALMKSPRLIGMRTHNGTLYQGVWPPLLSADEFAALNDRIRDFNRAKTWNPSLLSGLLICGRCGLKMAAGLPARQGGKARYQCKTNQTSGGCGLSISRPTTEEFVVSKLLRLMDEIQASGAPQVDYSTTLDVEEDREALKRVLALYGKGKLNEDAFWAEHDRLNARIVEAEVLQKVNEGTVRQFGSDWWAVADEKDRRRVLRDSIESIVVAPVEGAAGAYRDPTKRLTINLRNEWLKRTFEEKMPSGRERLRREITDRKKDE